MGKWGIECRVRKRDEKRGKGKGSRGRNKEVVNNTANMFGIMCVCVAHAYPPLLC